MVQALVLGLKPRIPGLESRSVHLGFVAIKVVLGLVFHRVVLVSPVYIIPPWLCMLKSLLGDEQ
jgi:hypothetical protein